MNTAANADQQEYWNTVAGPRWVELAGFVEKRVQKVNDLLLARSAVAGEKVLEVGCGTGAATVPLAEAVGNTGEVVGIDISEPMLAAARERISNSGLRNITLLRAERAGACLRAQPLRPDRVALWRDVLCRSSRRFPKPARRGPPRRAAVLSCWAALEENRHWLIPYEVALRHLGPPAPKPTHAPGPMAFADPEYLRSVLERAGYEAIDIRRETPEIIGASPQEEAEHACIMGPSGRLIEEKKPQDSVRELIKQEMTEAFAAYAKGGGCSTPSTIFLVTARRAASFKHPTQSGM